MGNYAYKIEKSVVAGDHDFFKIESLPQDIVNFWDLKNWLFSNSDGLFPAFLIAPKSEFIDSLRKHKKIIFKTYDKFDDGDKLKEDFSDLIAKIEREFEEEVMFIIE